MDTRHRRNRLAGAHNALYYPWLAANFGNRPAGLNGYKSKWRCQNKQIQGTIF